MSTKQPEAETKPGVSKVKLALGAASLFLFIIGLKRTFQVDEEQEGTLSAASAEPEAKPSQQRKAAG